MKFEMIKKNEIKKATEIVQKIQRISELMKEVYDLCGNSAVITFSEKYSFEMLTYLNSCYKEKGYNSRTLIGCFVIDLGYCKIKIFRKY